MSLHVHAARYAPVVVVILGLVLGLYVAGVATLPGLAFLVAIFHLQRRVGGKIAALRSRIVAQTDRRVRLMHDLLAGSETLKVGAGVGGGPHTLPLPRPHPHPRPRPRPRPRPHPHPQPHPAQAAAETLELLPASAARDSLVVLCHRVLSSTPIK